MLWTITWLGDTRERFKTLVRQRITRWPIPGDAGDFAAAKVEEEISVHPIPSPDLLQFEDDCVFAFGGVRVHYHINSRRHEAEVREVHDPA